jgi:hypothetical protein
LTSNPGQAHRTRQPLTGIIHCLRLIQIRARTETIDQPAVFPRKCGLQVTSGRRCLHLRCSLGVAAFLLCVGIGVPPPAAAQSRPPSRPSATVAIHQIQVALIGSGMLGGGTLNYRGATYRFRLEGLGSAGLEYRVLTPQEASPTCAAWLISRVFTVRSAAGGLLETRARAHSGCKMQTASICGWSVYAAGYH